MNRYKIQNKLGEGAFSSVMLALDTTTNSKVAIKKMKKRHWKDSAANFEVEALSKMNHPNIVKLISSFREDYRSYLVFECMECNLLEYTQSDSKNSRLPNNMCGSEVFISNVTIQILRGLEHIHKLGYFHRDLKPENILLTVKDDGQLSIKVADFGLARSINNSVNIHENNQLALSKIFSGRPLTTYISTRWYRAPEVLLGSKFYSSSIDVWAVGTIVAELALKHPLFPGMNQVDQLRRIFSLIPLVSEVSNNSNNTSINPNGWNEGLNAAISLKIPLPTRNSSNLSNDSPAQKTLKNALSGINQSIAEFIEYVLVLNPKYRPNSAMSLAKAEKIFLNRSEPYITSLPSDNKAATDNSAGAEYNASNYTNTSPSQKDSKNIKTFNRASTTKPINKESPKLFQKKSILLSFPADKAQDTEAEDRKVPELLKKLRNKSNTESISRSDAPKEKYTHSRGYFRTGLTQNNFRTSYEKSYAPKKHKLVKNLTTSSVKEHDSTRELTLKFDDYFDFSGKLNESTLNFDTSKKAEDFIEPSCFDSNISDFFTIKESTDFLNYGNIDLLSTISDVDRITKKKDELESFSNVSRTTASKKIIPNKEKTPSTDITPETKPVSIPSKKSSAGVKDRQESNSTKKTSNKLSALKNIISNSKKSFKNSSKSFFDHQNRPNAGHKNFEEANYTSSMCSSSTDSNTTESSPFLNNATLNHASKNVNTTEDPIKMPLSPQGTDGLSTPISRSPVIFNDLNRTLVNKEKYSGLKKNSFLDSMDVNTLIRDTKLKENEDVFNPKSIKRNFKYNSVQIARNDSKNPELSGDYGFDPNDKNIVENFKFEDILTVEMKKSSSNSSRSSKFSSKAMFSPLFNKSKLKKSKSFISVGMRNNDTQSSFSRMSIAEDSCDYEFTKRKSLNRTISVHNSPKKSLKSPEFLRGLIRLNKKNQSYEKSKNRNVEISFESSPTINSSDIKKLNIVLPIDQINEIKPKKTVFSNEKIKEFKTNDDDIPKPTMLDYYKKKPSNLFNVGQKNDSEIDFTFDMFAKNFESKLDLDFSISFINSPIPKPISFGELNKK
ncbi:Cyclin-dependent kinase F-3 [Smittium culicis]|uniref:Cyclin-dependent kinase F-3 n=1 Tax=Smittium culicis TaxID=133412 RepID=A0A1R1YAI6_9FUNG|nr:Cyclin-dependent kinase F-3 [Smittium culicis]